MEHAQIYPQMSSTVALALTLRVQEETRLAASEPAQIYRPIRSTAARALHSHVWA